MRAALNYISVLCQLSTSVFIFIGTGYQWSDKQWVQSGGGGGGGRSRGRGLEMKGYYWCARCDDVEISPSLLA